MTPTFLTHEERDLFSEFIELDPNLLDETEDASDEAQILKSQLEDKAAIERLAKFSELAKQELEIVNERRKKLDNAKKNLDRKIEFFRDQMRILVGRYGEKTKTGTFAYPGEFFKCTLIKQFSVTPDDEHSEEYVKEYKVTMSRIVNSEEEAKELADSFEDSNIQAIMDTDKIKEAFETVKSTVKDTTPFKVMPIPNDKKLVINQSLQLRVT